MPMLTTCGCRRASSASPATTSANKGREVPAGVTVDGVHTVGEAVHRFELDPPVPYAAGHHPAAGRTDVDSPEHRGLGGGHRRNAAATPASTGMCRPVVWLRSAEQSTKTALATFSGSTSRLRRVRWA